MSDVTQKLLIVKENIRKASLRRPPELQNREPRLVAVTKTKPKELIIEAYKAGQRHFGENYVQEILEKAFDEDVLKTCPNIKWHFIGHLQRNKVGKLLTVPNLFIIETIDSEKLADAVNSGWEKAEKGNDKLKVYIQVNASGEETKSGCHPNDVVKIAKHIVENCSNLNLIGLMTIGKYNYDAEKGMNPDFQCLIKCRYEVCNALNIEVNDFDLSMGTTIDYEHAVRHYSFQKT